MSFGPVLIRIFTFSLVILVINVKVFEGKCPSKEYSWCLQIDGYDSVILDGGHFPKIKQIMGPISTILEGSSEGKNFDQFLLFNNREVKQLEENTFADLTFRSIKIKNCTNLIRIDPNAFNGTQHLITKVHIDLISISGNKNVQEFFEALNNLVKLEELELYNHNIITIPPHAFRQQYLNKLELDGPLDTIKNNAFFHLDGLRILKLFKTIKHIPKHSFDFKTSSNKTLDIYFKLNFITIDSGVFTHVLRPITLNLYLSKLAQFDEIVFDQILMSDYKHDIIFHGELKDMNNRCILSWLFNQSYNFKGKFSFKTDPSIGEKDFRECSPLNKPINESPSSINSGKSESPINSIPYLRFIDKYLILIVSSLYLMFVLI